MRSCTLHKSYKNKYYEDVYFEPVVWPENAVLVSLRYKQEHQDGVDTGVTWPYTTVGVVGPPG